MRYRALQHRLPAFLRRHILHFESEIENTVTAFSAALPHGARVLDAGAGECRFAGYFQKHCYFGVDLGVGDSQWNYKILDAVADLTALPFASDTFDACINIVTLEHVCEPARALAEMQRVLKPEGRLLLIVPHEWEVHQAPYDYFRYTRHGVQYLLDQAGYAEIAIEPVGGYFRMLSRRLLNGMQFFPGPLLLLAGLVLAPPALLLPFLDSLDRERNFTLGYICTANKRS